jgi:hypothetical protein
LDQSVQLHETHDLKDENYLRARLGQVWLPHFSARIDGRTMEESERRAVSTKMAELVAEAEVAETDDLGPLAEVLAIGLFTDEKSPYMVIPTSPREAGVQLDEQSQFPEQHHDGYILTSEGKITTEMKFFRESVSSGGEHVLLRVGHKINEAIQGHRIPTKEESAPAMREGIHRAARAFIVEQLSPEQLTDEDRQLLARCREALQEKIERDYHTRGGQHELSDIALY